MIHQGNVRLDEDTDVIFNTEGRHMHYMLENGTAVLGSDGICTYSCGMERKIIDITETHNCDAAKGAKVGKKTADKKSNGSTERISNSNLKACSDAKIDSDRKAHTDKQNYVLKENHWLGRDVQHGQGTCVDFLGGGRHP